MLKDYQNAPITDAEKVLFWFVEKVNRCSIEIHQRDIEDMHRAGWNDEAVHDAINVCGLFNFYNRWIDATGVHALSDEAHRVGGKRSAAGGYAR